MNIKKSIIALISSLTCFSCYSSENKITSESKNTNKTPKNILILMAMQEEANPFIEKLNLKKEEKLSLLYRNKYYSGNINGNHVYLLLNGKKGNTDYVGSEATVISLVLGIEKFKPDILINVGTAGALTKSGIKIGDILNISESYYLDRNIPIPDYKIYSEGHFKANLLDNKTEKHKICSSLSFVTKENINNKMESLGCEVFDMEAASFSFISSEANKKFYIIKGVTDYVDGEFNAVAFQNNFKIVINKLAEYVKNKLENIDLN
ncbi:hypothetical protein [Silvanigrella sp.]|jgi:adenosylhomocysteine nucleosidase|uniref:phosphorylase family protein n=1 Tax=Silvanigrella sp. TaxID=2024976 RepID=UPI0037C5DF06